MRNKLAQVAFRTSLMYGIFAALWIFLSDRILIVFVSDPVTLNALQTYKGLGFVVITALLLYAAMRGQLRKWEEEAEGRRRAEEALRQSEDRYRQLFEAESDAIFLIDNETGRLLEANAAASFLYGYSREELLAGKNADLSAEPEDTKRVTRESPVIFDQVVTIPLRFHRKKDGTVFPVEITGRFFSWQGKPVHIAAIRDITRRRESEEALRESEERFRQLAESIDAMFWMESPDGSELHYISPAFEKIWGIPVEEFLLDRTAWIRAIHPDDSGRVMGWLKEHSQREPYDLQEFRVTRPDGGVRWVSACAFPVRNEMGEIYRVAGFALDITQRKQAEEALRRSEAQANQLAQENAIMAELGRILSSTLNIDEVYGRFAEEARRLISFDRVSIHIVNHEEKTVTTSYSTGKAVTGRQAGDVFPLAGSAVEEVLRSRSGLFLHPVDQSDLERRLPGLVPSYLEGQRSMMVVPLISKNRGIGALYFGSMRPGAFGSRDLKLAENIGLQIAGAVANAQLFTERQRLEERLGRAEKMEAMGTLAGGVAHDMNNILGVLVGYSELLLMEIPEGSPLRNHVTNILQAGQRGAAIIQDLLTLARRGVTVSQVVNLNGVVSDHLRTPEFEKLKSYHPHVIFKADLDKELMNIKGSPIHLAKTVMNLFSNAAEAIPDDGEVTVQTENRYLDRPVSGYDAIQEGEYVVLRVSDNGKGILPDDMRKIFEPFYTKKVMGRSGTGLGLAVVWGTVKDHHGYIDVQSEEGKGSVFALYFPVTREALLGGQVVAPPESYRGRGESILVVDDVKGQRDLASAMLGRLGYHVAAVSSGEEAVAYMQTHSASLLLLDMIMEPGMDGLETYRKVLEIRPKQKAIIVSGFSETDRVREVQELGAGAYVRKPYTMETIGLAVRKELDRG